MPFLEKVKQFKWRHPRRFWLLATGIVLLILLVGFGVFAKTWTFKKSITYGDCEIQYGKTVKEWDGKGSEGWNENGYHYLTKQFLVKATAPEQFFPKVAESPPNNVATSNIDGTDACQAGFTGLVDTNHADYKWFGARPLAARLGVPDLKDANDDGRISSDDSKFKPDPEISPPVFGQSHHRAAAWIDDGAQAVIQNHNKEVTRLLWCQGHFLPLDARGACTNIGSPSEGELPNRGSGFLFTSDNCPLKDCAGVDGWYNQDAAHRDLDYSATIGKNEKGELLPFYLHLSAQSTYASTMGTWMTITYKYPQKPELTSQVTTVPKTVLPGGNFEVKVAIGKIGPDLKSVTVNKDLNGQPIKEITGFVLSDDAINAVNRGESSTATASFQLSGGEAGKCYDMPISISAVATSPNTDPKKSDEEHRVDGVAGSARYCIATPTAASYTYEVNSRGAIQSSLDEFIQQAGETLVSQLGWSKAGVSFARVESGGDFTLLLAAPDQVATFAGCDSTYSCRSGRYVIINDERWRTATPAWNSGGGSLRDYRHMVVNHETGHWLGFGHLSCPAAGSPAPVMQQQSISLQGCAFNPWPTANEIELLKARL